MVSVMTFPRASLLLAFVAVFAIPTGSSFAQNSSPSLSAADAPPDADRVVQELCGKSVALLGESPLHGFAKTLEFKVALVPRLMDECHYNAFFIESGIYDFLNIEKRLKSGQEVGEPMLAAAIGGLWATREVQPLIPFLLDRAKAGRVVLGGLDDQVQRGGYAQLEMSADLVGYLQGEEKARCLAILQKNALWQYTEDSPYSPKDKALIQGCLDNIENSLTNAPASAAPWREYYTAMVEARKKSLAWDFRQLPKGVDENILTSNERDQWMYLNFQWLVSRLPAHSKVIVWAANTHVAKDLSGVPGKEELVPFGSYVRHEFKSRAFALGFSAYSGSYAMTGQPVRPLSLAPGDSLEARTFAGRQSDTAYLSSKDLRKLGSIPARLAGSTFNTARWSSVLDGLIIFREDRPPDFLPR